MFIAACGSETPAKESPENEGEEHISRITVQANGAKTIYNFSYSSDLSVNIDIALLKGNVSIHQDINEKGHITEAISGRGITNHFYGPEGQRIGTFYSSENTNVEYTRDAQNRPVKQVTVRGKDTLVVHEYAYQNGTAPTSVKMTNHKGESQEFRLKFDDKPNVLRDKFEIVYPMEDAYWLGNLALYGAFNLIKAELISEVDKPLNAKSTLYGIVPREINYEFVSKGDQLQIRSTSAGTRNWSAIIEYSRD